MMIAHAAYLDGLVVQEETFVDVEAKGANAERGLVAIDYSSALL
jgi:hypothetical protein